MHIHTHVHSCLTQSPFVKVLVCTIRGLFFAECSYSMDKFIWCRLGAVFVTSFFCACACRCVCVHMCVHVCVHVCVQGHTPQKPLLNATLPTLTLHGSHSSSFTENTHHGVAG